MKNKQKFLLLPCLYALFVALFFGSIFAEYFSDKKLVKNNEFEVIAPSIWNFEWREMKVLEKNEFSNEPIISLSDDPNFVFRKEMYLNSVSVYIKSDHFSGEPIIYYMEKGDQDFSNKKSVAPTYCDTSIGAYRFDFPTKKIIALRIDPITNENCVFEVSEIVFNANRTLDTYFHFGVGQALFLLIAPFLLWCAILQIFEIVKKKI